MKIPIQRLMPSRFNPAPNTRSAFGAHHPAAKPLETTNPIFAENGVAPFVARSKDFQDCVDLWLNNPSTPQERIANDEDLRRTMLRQPDDVLMAFVKPLICGPGEPDSKFFAVWPEYRASLQSPNAFRRAIGSESGANAKAHKARKRVSNLEMMQERFHKNPQGVLLILKNTRGEIVGMDGINPFQATHDFDILRGIKQGLDPRHALESHLLIRPDLQRRGLGEALKALTFQNARRQFGYRYIHSCTRLGHPSQRLNERMGFTKVTPETRFENSPAFTPETIRQLLREYQTDTSQWRVLDLDSPAGSPGSAC